jgi:hypothetical protein
MLLDSHLAAGRKQRRAMLEDTVDVELVKGEQAVRARRATLGAFSKTPPVSGCPHARRVGSSIAHWILACDVAVSGAGVRCALC